MKVDDDKTSMHISFEQENGRAVNEVTLPLLAGTFRYNDAEEGKEVEKQTLRRTVCIDDDHHKNACIDFKDIVCFMNKTMFQYILVTAISPTKCRCAETCTKVKRIASNTWCQ
jgi:hypothetical protein